MKLWGNFKMSRCQYCEIHNEEYSESLDAKHYDDSCSVGVFSHEDLESEGLPMPDDLYDGVCDTCYQKKMGEL